MRPPALVLALVALLLGGCPPLCADGPPRAEISLEFRPSGSGMEAFNRTDRFVLTFTHLTPNKTYIMSESLTRERAGVSGMGGAFTLKFENPVQDGDTLAVEVDALAAGQVVARSVTVSPVILSADGCNFITVPVSDHPRTTPHADDRPGGKTGRDALPSALSKIDPSVLSRSDPYLDPRKRMVSGSGS